MANGSVTVEVGLDPGGEANGSLVGPCTNGLGADSKGTWAGAGAGAEAGVAPLGTTEKAGWAENGSKVFEEAAAGAGTACMGGGLKEGGVGVNADAGLGAGLGFEAKGSEFDANGSLLNEPAAVLEEEKGSEKGSTAFEEALVGD